MKRRKVQLAGPLLLGWLAALMVVSVGSPACAQASGYELCVEHSPAQAGRVTPGTGTHHFSPNAVVTLSAEPQPGYEFAYWIGDVDQPKSPSTTVRVDTSKIVVAVFKPTLIDQTDPKITLGGGGGGGGALVPTKVDMSGPAFSISGGGGGGRKVAVPVPVIVTPEPATILLLGSGALVLRRRRRPAPHGARERRGRSR